MSTRNHFEKETKGNLEMVYWCIQLELIPISVAVRSYATPPWKKCWPTATFSW